MYKFLSETNEVDKSSDSCFTSNENIVLVGLAKQREILVYCIFSFTDAIR